MARITKDADVRRQELIDIGFPLYMQNGISGLSIKDIVREADVATGLFYYYFKSKEVFVEEAVNDFIIKKMKTIQQILDSNELTSVQKVKIAMDNFWEYTEQMFPHKENSLFCTEQHYTLTNKLLEEMYPFLLNTIVEGNADKVFNVSNPSLMAGFILYGLSSLLNSQVEVNSMTRKDLYELVYRNLGIHEMSDIYE